ncbi:hypothetical protein [Kitasatospora sp. NPDC057015]
MPEVPFVVGGSPGPGRAIVATAVRAGSASRRHECTVPAAA